MLEWLRPRLPSRSWTNNLRLLQLDHGRSKVSFNDKALYEEDSCHPFLCDKEHDAISTSVALKRASQSLVYNSLPPASSDHVKVDEANSSLCPPWHLHLHEDETFQIVSGTAKFLLLDSRQRKPNKSSEDGKTTRLVSCGTSITVPRGQIHTFRNASTRKRLDLQFGFSSSSSLSQVALNKKMRLFFLNTQLYRSDCTKHGVPRSLLQILLFNHCADVVLVPQFLLELHRRLPVIRDVLERRIAPFIGRAMNFVGGVVLGQWLCGLSSRYEEYVKEAPVTCIIEQANTQVAQIGQNLHEIEAALGKVKDVEHKNGFG